MKLFQLAKDKQTQTYSTPGFYVYYGYDKITNEIVYVGTTIQKPADRFRWHKANKKDLRFEVVKSCANETEMLDYEFELIQVLKPKLNKITKRKQNLNRTLTNEELSKRIGDKEWCQLCLKRRVNKGYSKCYYC